MAIIDAGLKRKDVFAVLPTGGGKSLCFQLPALTQNGLTIVVSPLLALMRDQMSKLKEKGLKAAMLSSDITDKDRDRVIGQLLRGQLKLLYLSPEQLAKSSIAHLLDQVKINRIVIDEAHCASSWGHDFRPDYRALGTFINARPYMNVSAFTATATPEVVEDLYGLLFKKRKPKTFIKSPMRSNISIEFQPKMSPREQLMKSIPRIGSVVIYAGTRSKTEVLAKAIGKEADYYHAGLNPDERRQKETNFLDGTTRIMVATNAFGMGVDKADIRCVIHADLPPSIESYVQEIGRSGRDGSASSALCLFNEDDIEFRVGHIKNGTHDAQRRDLQSNKLAGMLSLAMDQKGWEEIDAYFGFGEIDFKLSDDAQSICEFHARHKSHNISPELLRWRSKIATTKRYAPFMVLPDAILSQISDAQPKTIDELAAIKGIGKSRLEKYGAGILEALGNDIIASSSTRRAIALSHQGDIFERLREISLHLRLGEFGTERPIDLSEKILARIVKANPQTHDELLKVNGMDDNRVKRFGDAFLLELRNNNR